MIKQLIVGVQNESHHKYDDLESSSSIPPPPYSISSRVTSSDHKWVMNRGCEHGYSQLAIEWIFIPYRDGGII